MTRTAKQILGTLALIALTILYPALVMEIYARFLVALPWWAAIVVLAAAGALWFWPASRIVAWMARPAPISPTNAPADR